jgi:hypothetical protein
MGGVLQMLKKRQQAEPRGDIGCLQQFDGCCSCKWIFTLVAVSELTAAYCISAMQVDILGGFEVVDG